jgi:hypothetical protein
VGPGVNEIEKNAGAVLNTSMNPRSIVEPVESHIQIHFFALAKLYQIGPKTHLNPFDFKNSYKKNLTILSHPNSLDFKKIFTHRFLES